MEKLQHSLHYPYENGLSGLCSLAPCLDTGLCKLDVPVAVNVPDEVIKLLAGNAQLKGFKVLIYLACKGVELAYYSLVLGCEVFGESCEPEVLGKIHKNES